MTIPGCLTPSILCKLHEDHQGEEKSKLRAKDGVYWVNINKDLESTVAECLVYQQHKNSQMRETQFPHEHTHGNFSERTYSSLIGTITW